MSARWLVSPVPGRPVPYEPPQAVTACCVETLRAEAAALVACCPDHGTGETRRMACACDVAEELRQRAGTPDGGGQR